MDLEGNVRGCAILGPMGFNQLFFLIGPILGASALAQAPLRLYVEGPKDAIYLGQTCPLNVVLEGPRNLLRTGLSQLFPQRVEIPLDWSIPWLESSFGEEISRVAQSDTSATVVLNGKLTGLTFEEIIGGSGGELLRLSLPMRWTPDRTGAMTFPPVAISYSLKPGATDNALGLGNSPGPSKRLEAQLDPITVIAIPDTGRDPAWNGALGHFTMSLAAALPEPLAAGEEVVLEVLVRGEGNPGSAPRWGSNQRARFRVLEEELTSDGALWRYGLTTRGPGMLMVPPLVLHLFDPAQGQFSRVELPGQQVRVMGPVAGPRDVPDGPSPSRTLLFVAIGLPLGLVIFLLLFRTIFKGRV